MSRTFKLTVAYDGTTLAGWQVQPDRKTVQGLLESALAKLTGCRIPVVGSGRTDAGVHAIAQVASCQLPDWNHSPEALMRAINTHLPDCVAVTEAAQAVDGFHAIRDASGKRYRYQLQIGGPKNVFEHRYRWHIHTAIDIEKMVLAASRLVGRQDFASFQAAGSDRKTTVRNIRACEVVVQQHGSPSQWVAIEVEADGFLYNMVRNIVGTLVQIGNGRHSVGWIDEVIAKKDRKFAGPTAPPQGLFLLRVYYPKEVTDLSEGRLG